MSANVDTAPHLSWVIGEAADGPLPDALVAALEPLTFPTETMFVAMPGDERVEIVTALVARGHDRYARGLNDAYARVARARHHDCRGPRDVALNELDALSPAWRCPRCRYAIVDAPERSGPSPSEAATDRADRIQFERDERARNGRVHAFCADNRIPLSDVDGPY